ncbi:hypothetical protein D4S03_11110 [bacterium]|nr:MAG: hypothetical protein D4S03_11110 [bacterium]
MFAFLFFIPMAALAATSMVQDNCNPIGSVSPLPVPCLKVGILGGSIFATGPAGEFTISGLLLGLIDIGLLVVGILAVLFVIIGGFRYVTALGNEEATTAAKKTITNAVLGIIIVILSFVMIRVISFALIAGIA